MTQRPSGPRQELNGAEVRQTCGRWTALQTIDITQISTYQPEWKKPPPVTTTGTAWSVMAGSVRPG